MAGCVKSKITHKKMRMETKNSITTSGVKKFYLSSFLFLDMNLSNIRVIYMGENKTRLI